MSLSPAMRRALDIIKRDGFCSCYGHADSKVSARTIRALADRGLVELRARTCYASRYGSVGGGRTYTEITGYPVQAGGES